LPLIPGLGAGDPAWHYLAGLRDIVLQGVDVLVIDLYDAIRGKFAKAPASEIT
jgi:hypothetical protein